MYRHQLVLKQLGIQQWIAQQQATAIHHMAVLWRDQNTAPTETPPNAQYTADHHSHVAHRTDTALEKAVINTPSLANQQPNPLKAPVQPDSHTPISHLDFEEKNYPQSIALNCHFMLHEHFTLLTTIENEQQQRLFNQIKLACHASSLFIQWPLAIETWEMNDHVLQSYLKGVFADHQDKVCFCLGTVDIELGMLTKPLQIHASLQQLLESAEHKRALWQALYPYVYDVESQNA